MELTLENSIRAGVCETCAEGGHPNEPVYKMGMCEFRYKGLPRRQARPMDTLGTHLITAFLEAELAEVRSQEGESIENLLRRFKRKVQTEDIIKDVKRHSFYLKPGEKKRVKQALAQKRARKKTRTYTDERR